MKTKQLQKNKIYKDNLNLAKLTKDDEVILKISFNNSISNISLLKKLTEIIYIRYFYNQNKPQPIFIEREYKLFLIPKLKTFKAIIYYHFKIFKDRKSKFINLDDNQNKVIKELDFQKIFALNFKKLYWKFNKTLRRYIK